MSTMMMADRWRWTVAAVGATVFMAGLVILFRIPMPTQRLSVPSRASDQAPPPSVQLAKPTATDMVLTELMVLRDMRPLFLPTEWNAALPEPKLEPGRIFLENETLKLSFSESDLNISRDLALTPVVTLNGKVPELARPSDVLAPDSVGPTLIGFGRNKTAIEPLPQRGGFVEVFSTATGQPVLSQMLGVEARPPGDKAWGPMELLAAIDAAGVAAPLVVTEGSRVEEVDAHFRNFLARTYRIGERLPPGFYRIVVSP